MPVHARVLPSPQILFEKCGILVQIGKVPISEELAHAREMIVDTMLQRCEKWHQLGVWQICKRKKSERPTTSEPETSFRHDKHIA